MNRYSTQPRLMTQCLLVAVLLVCGVGVPSANATLWNAKENCTFNVWATFSDLSLECDECTGYGWATWYFQDQFDTSPSSHCADKESEHQSVNVGINTNTGDLINNPQDFEHDLWTWGSVSSGSCGCVTGSTKRECHIDWNVYNQYQAEKVLTASVEEIWILKHGPLHINQDDIDAGEYTFSLSNSSTLSLQVNGGISGGIKDYIEVSVGFEVETSVTETAATSVDKDFVEADLGKYYGVFYYQTRIKQPCRYREFDCTAYKTSSPSWTNANAYQGTSRLPRLRSANSQQDILDIQDNGSWVSGSYVITQSGG